MFQSLLLNATFKNMKISITIIIINGIELFMISTTIAHVFSHYFVDIIALHIFMNTGSANFEEALV